MLLPSQMGSALELAAFLALTSRECVAHRQVPETTRSGRRDRDKMRATKSSFSGVIEAFAMHVRARAVFVAGLEIEDPDPSATTCLQINGNLIFSSHTHKSLSAHSTLRRKDVIAHQRNQRNHVATFATLSLGTSDLVTRSRCC